MKNCNLDLFIDRTPVSRQSTPVKNSFFLRAEFGGKLEIVELKGELKKKINTLCKYDLVIINELGYLSKNR